MTSDDDSRFRELLDVDRIVVIGASSTPGKDAHRIPAYLQRQGYEVVPVNPFADEVLGSEPYDSLEAVPGPIELIDVFRPSEEVADIVAAAIERGDVSVIWLQRGIRDDAAASRAASAGIDVVQDRCIMVTHRSLVA